MSRVLAGERPVSSLSGKTAFVFGANCAIGQACAETLSVQGARLFTADHNDLDDRGSDEAWQDLLQRSVKKLGRLDIYVHCDPVAPGRPVCETPLSDFREALYDSALSAWLGQKHAILAMREHGGGAIVQVISTLARAAAVNAAAGCAAHAGILMSSKAAALECAKHNDGIVINAVLGF